MTPLSSDSERAWLTLVRAPGLCNHIITLLDTLSGATGICAANAAQLAGAGLKAGSVDAITAPDKAALDNDQRWLQRSGRHLLPITDPRYPALLRNIDSPPVALFAAGDPQVLALPQLAIVGSRNPTPGGVANASAFAHYLANSGLAITSGLASGIDAAAHRGAIKAGGVTVAVCGTGLDQVYPPQHRDLAGQIAQNGILLSEFATGTPPRKYNFPRRNRIISGMAVGTLVIEAAARSGSLISAHLAISQGREVFAIPGSIHNPLARGCHQLIREGAKLVESAHDIMVELAPLLGLHLDADNETSAPQEPAADADDDYRLLLSALGWDPVTVDTLVEKSGLTPDAVSSMLLILELQGRVQAMNGGRYVRAREGG